MVKGVTRRVVVIKSPDKDIFDEAIFIVKDGLAGDATGSPGDVVIQAQLAADSYIRDHLERRRRRMPAPVYIALGAILSGAAMLLYQLVR
ncbi:MAG: translation initiation factor 2 [Oscillospiraceae bacterium]|jgi:hypothetical protein|nr:translation initiation factor 2 [Oscillospiraceae bacterium]